MCVLLITRLLRGVGRWARKPVNHTSWVTVVIPTDRPKSVRNCCLIELFCGVVCVVTLPLWHFCWYRGFCHRTGSDLLLFVFIPMKVKQKSYWKGIRANWLSFDMLDLQTKCCPRPSATILSSVPIYHMLPSLPVNNCILLQDNSATSGYAGNRKKKRLSVNRELLTGHVTNCSAKMTSRNFLCSTSTMNRYFMATWKTVKLLAPVVGLRSQARVS